MGGYQTWMGLHSFAEVGTGERVVDEVVDLLNELAQLDLVCPQMSVAEAVGAIAALANETIFQPQDESAPDVARRPLVGDGREVRERERQYPEGKCIDHAGPARVFVAAQRPGSANLHAIRYLEYRGHQQ